MDNPGVVPGLFRFDAVDGEAHRGRGRRRVLRAEAGPKQVVDSGGMMRVRTSR